MEWPGQRKRERFIRLHGSVRKERRVKNVAKYSDNPYAGVLAVRPREKEREVGMFFERRRWA
jgi:hypothetical protein